MKPLFVIFTLALAISGCATQAEMQLAQADCKVYPITTLSAAGRKPEVDSIRQRAAEADLANSGYRFRNLARNGPAGNAVEDILRDCNR